MVYTRRVPSVFMELLWVNTLDLFLEKIKTGMSNIRNKLEKLFPYVIENKDWGTELL